MKSFDIECREGEGVKKKEEKCCVTLFRMGSTETVWRNRVSCQVIVVKAAAWINKQTFQMIDLKYKALMGCLWLKFCSNQVFNIAVLI